MRARLLLLTAFFLLTCRGADRQPPVILISIDTLRSDHLPMYGYSGVKTPVLDALRADSILFTKAWSHSPLTLPSHTTMLTGLLPGNHGVRDNTGFRLASTVATLPALLKSRGYATGGAISAFVLRRATGIDSGFDDFDDAVERERGEKSLGAVQRAGQETARIAASWIDTHSSKPFFYFLHLYEPHAPYEPSYDGEIERVDRIVGDFLEGLKRNGVYDRAMIVLVSDHGEGLGDHGEEEHGIFLYREAISVPMLIKLPGGKERGTKRETAAGLVDVTPTILARVGASGRFDGVDLLGEKVASRSIYSETYYPRFHFGWSDLHSIVDGRDHFIDAPRDELYDLAADPRETRDLKETNRRRYIALRDAAARFQKEPVAPSAVSEEEKQKLAALGYIGSATQTEGPLADPKDKIGTFHELQAAFRLYREHRDVEALAAFDRLLKSEQGMIDLWDVRSKVLFRLGRTAEGVAAAKEALRRNPSATYLAADLANELLLAGDLKGAREHADLALRSDPGKAHEILARVEMTAGDMTAALDHAQQAVKASGSEPAMYTLARVQQKRGDWAATLEAADALLRKTSGTRAPAGLNALRGDALARLGREREAEAALREEIRIYPGSVEAYRSLIVLLVTENRTDEATSAVRALAAASPNARTYTVIADTLGVIGDDAGARYWRGRAARVQ